MLEDRPVFNNKVDIWSLGCILYELVMDEKAFMNDWQVMHYKLALKPKTSQVPHLPSFYESIVTSLLSGALAKDWWMRPSTRDILSVIDSQNQSFIDISIECSGSQILKNLDINNHEPESSVPLFDSFNLDVFTAVSLSGGTLQPKVNHRVWRYISWFPHWYPPSQLN